MTRKRIKSTDTAFDIIEALRDRDGATTTELAQALDRSTSTVHGHLVTLIERGYVARADGQYVLGVRFLELGATARRRRTGYDIIRPRIDRLAEETQERAQFTIEENGRGINVYVAEGQRAVPSRTEVGKLRYLNTSAAGKAILSSLPSERVASILDQHGLPRRTENTIVDRDALFDELDAVRRRGYAINREESARGLLAIGTAVRTPGGETLGAVSISGPVHRMKGSRLDEALPNQLLGTVEEIELNAEFS